jgi:hypothetical protein
MMESMIYLCNFFFWSEQVSCLLNDFYFSSEIFKLLILRLVEPKAIVFECGANCSCNHDCVNRTSQQGLQYRLEVIF